MHRAPTIGQKARPFGWVLCFLVIAALSSDHLSEHQPLVLFLGSSAQGDDPAFLSLRRAWLRRHADVASRVRLEQANAVDDGRASLQQSARAAVARQPDLLVAPSAGSAQAAARAAPGTPLVFSTYLDPKGLGLVGSLGVRAERSTGISLADDLHGKRMEILHDAYPAVRNVAVLADHEWSDAIDGEDVMRRATEPLGMSFHLFLADGRDEVLGVLASAEARRYDAWYVPRSLAGVVAWDEIVRRMRDWHTPCIYGSTEEVLAGGQMAYSQDTAFVWSTLADLVARVVDGEPPGRIPILRPHHFVLAIRTGDETGVPLPDPSVLRRADLLLR